MSELRHPFELDTEKDAKFFTPEVLAWRNERFYLYGETNRVIDLMDLTKDGVDHPVVWLERAQVDTITGEKTVVHHAACGCIAEAESEEHSGGPELMTACSVWNNALIIRASEERRRDPLSLDKMLQSAVKLGGGEGLGFDPVNDAIMHHLRTVSAMPQYWDGNIVGGQHETPLLSIIIDKSEDEVAIRAEVLEKLGLIEFDGDQSLRLAA